ncbi:shikimate kinase [Streptomyces sp. NPDC057621]|uniref:shikimate kinase n=1 Tax=unclassified Streptomyces TaxID=2593676 RepID=UPI0036BD69E0
MGVGKTTVGGLIAERLGLACRDTDADIVAAQARSIADIFATEGEVRFRDLERAAVRAALLEHRGVLALGGGAVLDARTRGLLAGGPVAFLDMEWHDAVQRVGTDSVRPLLAVDPEATWRRTRQVRRPLYLEVARAVVGTGGRTPQDVAGAVLEALALAPAPGR